MRVCAFFLCVFLQSHQNTIVTIIAQKYSSVKRGEQLTIQGSMSSQDTETDEQKAQREAIEQMKVRGSKAYNCIHDAFCSNPVAGDRQSTQRVWSGEGRREEKGVLPHLKREFQNISAAALKHGYFYEF